MLYCFWEFKLVFQGKNQMSPFFIIEKFVPLKLTIVKFTCEVSSVMLTVMFVRALIFVLLPDGFSHLLRFGDCLSFFPPGVKTERLNIAEFPSGYLPTEIFSNALPDACA